MTERQSKRDIERRDELPPKNTQMERDHRRLRKTDRRKIKEITWLLARYLPPPVVTIRIEAESATGKEKEKQR